MEAWESRPIEIKNLLNPAFCGELLLNTMTSYQVTAKKNFPFALSFLTLPIILHASTRHTIPIKQDMYSWIQENPGIKIGFADRTKQLVPYTKEALSFLLQKGYIIFDNEGNLAPVKSLKTRKKQTVTNEVNDCIKMSIILGRKFARSGSVNVTYAMWGVMP
ncbi:MAG: three component ABC system middle component [Methanoregula sp.]|jgi:hypothetical protein